MNAPARIEAATIWRTSDSLPALPYSTRVHVRLSDGSEDRKASFAGFWRDHCRPSRDRHGCQRAHVTHYRMAEPYLPARIDALASKRRAM